MSAVIELLRLLSAGLGIFGTGALIGGCFYAAYVMTRQG